MEKEQGVNVLRRQRLFLRQWLAIGLVAYGAALAFGVDVTTAGQSTFRALDVSDVSIEASVRPPYEKTHVSISKDKGWITSLSISVTDGEADVAAVLPGLFFKKFPDPQLQTIRILDSISEGSGVGIAVSLKYGPAVAVVYKDGECRLLTKKDGASERADSQIEYATAEIYIDLLEDRTLSFSGRDACFNPDEWEEELALKEGEHLTGTGWRAFQERIDRKQRKDARALKERGLDEIMVYTVTPKAAAWERLEMSGRSPEGKTQVDFGAKRGVPGFPAADRSNTSADLFGGVLQDLWIRIDNEEQFRLPKPLLSQFDRPVLDTLSLEISDARASNDSPMLKISFRYGLLWRDGLKGQTCNVMKYAEGTTPPSRESQLDTNRAEIVITKDGEVLSVSKRNPCELPI